MPAKKRKAAKVAPQSVGENEKRAEDATQDSNQPEPQPAAEEVKAPEEGATATPPPTAPAPAPAAEPADRMARFRALQARAKTSSNQNLKEAKREAHRLSTNPGELATLQRRHAVASHKLLRADVEESGGDFERKRAWDWTVEESERWDRRVRKKEGHRDDVAFADYTREAQKVYKRQLHGMAPDMEAYAREKLAAVERAAAAGTLEIVETDEGELIAVDRDGSFYATADSTSFAKNKPDKAAVDRLVNDVKKADEVALKKRRERMAANTDDGDVTYINEKNKQFNQKLARFYNKYTAEIRESFERGTMV
jgi:pre-mRNA-splicing factor SYF2